MTNDLCEGLKVKRMFKFGLETICCFSILKIDVYGNYFQFKLML